MARGTSDPKAAPCWRRHIEQWQWLGHVFRAPDQPLGYLRLGQWHATGAIQFDSVKLQPAVSVHTEHDGLVLGEGELIRDGSYEFLATFGHEASNYHRTLYRAAAAFNSDRWCFGGPTLGCLVPI